MINLDQFTESELIDINYKIAEHLRFLNQMRAHSKMFEFKIGDCVSFKPEGHLPAVGILTRYNKKTVTVITDDGQHWNVSPNFLFKAESPEKANYGKAKLHTLKKKLGFE